MQFNINLRAGSQIKDHKKRNKGRVITLEQRVNPMGEDVSPYWQVKNSSTGLLTLIREDQLMGKRWEQLN